MKYIVTIDGKHDYEIEAATQKEAEALAVRYFARDNEAGGADSRYGRVTGSRPA